MIKSSNMTPKEEFRLNGQLSEQTALKLLDAVDRSESLQGINAYIEEAMGSFPGEDFLESIKTKMTNLARILRGNNRKVLNDIIAELDEVAMLTYDEAAYGRDELRSALNAIR